MIPAIFLTLQISLLLVELFTSYDSFGRQNALALTNVVATLATLMFDRRLRRRGRGLSWMTFMMVAGAVWLDALGNFQHWYATLWWWDRVTHTLGGMALSALLLDMFHTTDRPGAAAWWRSTWLGFLTGQFVGMLYEISEFLGDIAFRTNRVGAGFDTPRDLTFNMLGGLFVVGLFWLVERARGTLRRR